MLPKAMTWKRTLIVALSMLIVFPLKIHATTHICEKLVTEEFWVQATDEKKIEAIKQCKRINIRDAQGNSILHFASGKILGDKKLENNGKPFWVRWEATITEPASRDVFEAIIDRGANLNPRNRRGYTPIFYFIANGADAKIIKSLLQNGANINGEFRGSGLGLPRCREEYECFIAAAIRYNSAETLEALFSFGATIENSKLTGFILGTANSAAFLDLLPHNGEKISEYEVTIDCSVPLMQAAGNASPDSNKIFDYVLARVDLNKQHCLCVGDGKRTPLHRAAFSDKGYKIKKLIELGYSASEKNCHGETPFQLMEKYNKGITTKDDIYWLMHDAQF